jgi:IS5 family transposase
MLRIMILQFLYDRSDRAIEIDLRMHLGFKYFAGLAADEAGPDHSTLSRFRGRVGAERFARIFNRIVEAARAAGLIADRLHAIDSSHFRANVATWRRRDDSDDDDDSPGGFVKFDDSPPGSPDPDAAWGAKSKNFKFFGYKHHIAVDADSGMIVSSVTTPGNRNDGAEMPNVVDDRAGAVVADKAYDSGKNHRLLARLGIGDRILRRGVDNGTKNRDRYVVERTNAIVKRWCGGGRARYWGLEKVSIQMTLASIAANLKRWLGLTAQVCCSTG